MLKEIERTLRHEGGFVDNPKDSGGITNHGLSLRYLLTIGDRDQDGTLDFDRDHDGDVDADDVKVLTLEDAAAQLKVDFYDPLQLGEVRSLRIRWKVFDLAVNMGKGTATKILQRAVGVQDDGEIGPLTLHATNRIIQSGLGEGYIMERIIEEQVKHYVRIAVSRPKDLAFLRGWVDRAYDRGKDLTNGTA